MIKKNVATTTYKCVQYNYNSTTVTEKKIKNEKLKKKPYVAAAAKKSCVKKKLWEK